jgi:hypothetical protein
MKRLTVVVTLLGLLATCAFFAASTATADPVQGRPRLGGPSSSVDEELARFDGTSGGTLQGTSWFIDDSKRLSVCNTVSCVTDAEIGRLYWLSGRLVLSAELTGAGAQREVRLLSGTGSLTLGPSTVAISTGGSTTSASAALTVSNASAFTSTANIQRGIQISGTVNQTSGSGGYDALEISPTVTGVGSAGATMLRIKPGGTDRARIDSLGQPTFVQGTAPPTNGAATSCIRVSSTANLGYCWGAGAPTFSAAQGTFYLNTTGSSASTRLYVNTNGSTGWTSVTTGS